LKVWADVGYGTKNRNGEEKAVYREWKITSDGRLGVNGEGGGKERARSMAALAARIGRLRAGEENDEADGD
jgi:hypothetical protein